MKKLSDIFKVKLTESTTRQSPDSVDSIIDSILLGYKQDAIQEGKLNKFFSMLLEAPEDEDVGEEGDEAPEDQTAGDDELDSEEAAPTNVPKIDIDMFVQKVINLKENYQSLMDVGSVILQRAVKVLMEAGYNQATIMEFKNILEREFGIIVDRSGIADDKDEVPMAPAGYGAGPEVG